MRKRTTLKDVARAAGVHVSTASRALDPKTRHPVSPDLAEHVQRISVELGYAQNAEAYSLRTRRTRIVGVVIPDITDPVYALILRGLEQALAPQRYVSIVATVDGNLRREADVIAMMRSRNVDGLILGSVEREDDLVPQLLAQGVPIVTLGRRVEGASVSSVTSDHVEGMRQTLDHLTKLGHHRIGHIAGPQSLSTGADRLTGFRAACAEFGVAVPKNGILLSDSYSIEEGQRCAQEFVGRSTDCTAVVCANDRLALGAITGFRQFGVECPRDMSVTGYNDMPLVDLLSPALTTVRVPLVQVGVQAAQLLLDLIGRPEQSRQADHIVLPVELIERNSTSVPVARA